MWALVFAATLFSHYEYAVGAPIISWVGAFLIATIPLVKGVPLKKFSGQQLVLAAAYCWIGIGVLVSTLYEFSTDYVKAPIVIVMALTLMWSIENHQYQALCRGFYTAIYLHLALQFIQLSAWIAGFGFVDYVYPLTGEHTRAFGGTFSLPWIGNAGLIRASGAFTEPGNFSNAVAILLSSYIIIADPQAGERSTQRLLGFSIFSLVVSFSVFGFFYATLFSLFFIVKLRISFLKLIFITVFAVLLIAIISPYLEYRIFSVTADTYHMNSLIELYKVFKDDPRWPIFLAFGVGAFSTGVFNGIVLNDFGLLIYVAIHAGIIGVLLFYGPVFYVSVKNSRYFLCGWIFTIILVVTKLSFSYVILVLCYAAVLKKQARDHRAQDRFKL